MENMDCMNEKMVLMMLVNTSKTELRRLERALTIEDMALLIIDTLNAIESGFHLCLGRVKHGKLDLKAVLWKIGRPSKGAGRHFKIASNRTRL